jgi:hypothetical protein
MTEKKSSATPSHSPVKAEPEPPPAPAPEPPPVPEAQQHSLAPEHGGAQVESKRLNSSS